MSFISLFPLYILRMTSTHNSCPPVISKYSYRKTNNEMRAKIVIIYYVLFESKGIISIGNHQHDLLWTQTFIIHDTYMLLPKHNTLFLTNISRLDFFKYVLITYSEYTDEFPPSLASKYVKKKMKLLPVISWKLIYK